MLIANLERPTPKQSEQNRAKLRKGTREQASPIESMDVEHRLSWAAVAEMHQSGVSFGSHTQTHPILTMIPLDTARQEVRESKAAIERALSEGCDAFAYPNGNWSPQIRDMLAEAGFRLAVTTAYGAWTTASDRLAIPRLNISEDNVIGLTHRFSPTIFEYATFWRAWRATKADSVLTSVSTTRPTHKVNTEQGAYGNSDNSLAHQ
jgi:hypothetical protein